MTKPQKEIDLDALHREPHFVCEWCEPSDIPMRQPERCAILYCPIHDMKCWHWPKEAAIGPPLDIGE